MIHNPMEIKPTVMIGPIRRFLVFSGLVDSELISDLIMMTGYQR